MESILFSLSNFRHLASSFPLSSLLTPLIVLLVLTLLVLPIPPVMLDVFFTFNIILALLIIMVAIHTATPMDFSSFPIIILFATVMRLGLNVASTRVVLIEGYQGGDAAGKVIEAFGQFVIGGNYAVGLIVFVILMIINFIVITKGAGRVSEVIARFTLDALPGKQMAIDADLNAGVIDQETARIRRAQVTQESDFFGSMDGASKFVRGDAIAGILILLINLIGGLAIGMLQHDLSLQDASRAYVLLTIGDGLVAQIPALILSLATAVIVSRVTTDESAPEQATKQLSNPLAFGVAGGTLVVLGLIPGMPNAVFLILGLSAAALSYFLRQKQNNEFVKLDEIETQKIEKSNEEVLELDWDDAGQVDVISVELGYGLIPLIEEERHGRLLQRAKGIRKKMSGEFGFLLPTIRIRDNLDIPPHQYQLVVNGSTRGRGDIELGKFLAINPGSVLETISGTQTKEPAFGLEAVWIDAKDKEYAQAVGYTVVDTSTVVATHLNSVLRDNAEELLTYEITEQLVNRIEESSPKLIEELIPDNLSLSAVLKVLQNLLSEGVPIKDMRTILETLSDAAPYTKAPEALTSYVRSRLGRLIMQQLCDPLDTLEVITLDPNLEQILTDLVKAASSVDEVTLEPNLAQTLIESLSEEVNKSQEQDRAAVLIVSPTIRQWLSIFIGKLKKELSVLSYREVPDDQSIKIVRTIELSERD
ncbi:MAG TPA: flagellar biosynthesis protein FlhA [Gammaproteobacteria bacterium]|nr:flagellar biosynthesis protein FlhA [Gammaproteobacteria bacterium]